MQAFCIVVPAGELVELSFWSSDVISNRLCFVDKLLRKAL
jgi:hypothetical protein